jgi:hypothetical protein
MTNLAKLLRLYHMAMQQGLQTTCLLSKFIKNNDRIKKHLQQQQQWTPSPVHDNILNFMLEHVAHMVCTLCELNHAAATMVTVIVIMVVAPANHTVLNEQ